MADDSVEFEARQEYLETKSAGMSRNYFCVDCKSTTRNPRLYLEHRRDFHKEPMSIHACSFCVYASKHSQKLARHLRTVHRDVLQDISVQSTRSAVFNQMAEAIPDSFQTNQSGKNTRLSTCKLCGLYTVSKVMLMQHIRTQHPDVRIYECDQCDYTHYIRDRYNRHHRYHSMNQIQCKLCEFQTIYRWNLERHMRHHIDSVSLGFRCTKCNFTVSTKQSITAHEIAHHGGILGENIAIESVDSQMSEDPNISNKPEQEIEIESEIEGEKQENDCVSNNVDVEKQPEERHNFDANAFLEVILDDTSQPKPETTDTRFKDAVVMFKDTSLLQSSSELSEWQSARKTKHFFCINCSFRNEIDLSNWPDGITDGASSFCTPPKNEPQSFLYRCGYCHQTSNWKHVIERHCRLVHNTTASIEKYSNQYERFKPLTPIKRRTDFSTKTITTLKKKTKVENNTEKHIYGHLFEKHP